MGCAKFARMPYKDLSFQIANHSLDNKVYEQSHGKIPEKIIDETEEDILVFVNALEKIGITVKRPKPIHFEEKIKTMHWQA